MAKSSRRRGDYGATRRRIPNLIQDLPRPAYMRSSTFAKYAQRPETLVRAVSKPAPPKATRRLAVQVVQQAERRQHVTSHRAEPVKNVTRKTSISKPRETRHSAARPYRSEPAKQSDLSALHCKERPDGNKRGGSSQKRGFIPWCRR